MRRGRESEREREREKQQRDREGTTKKQMWIAQQPIAFK